MAKIYPEMVAIGRPARREPDLRRGAAFKAMESCGRLLEAILGERFPERIPGVFDPAVLVGDAHEAFFEEAAFLFDIAMLRGLKEEPTQSVRDAFALLLERETPNTADGRHIPWLDWSPAFIGSVHIAALFDEAHARAVNPDADQAMTDLFSRTHKFLQRIELIIECREETVSTYILDLMPEAVRVSIEGSIDYEKMAFDKPWMSIVECFGVYRHKLAKELGVTERTLANYERAGKTPKGGYWPAPLNPDDGPGKKYYDPMHALKALSALPQDFSKATRVDDIIVKLMNNKLASKITPKSPKAEPEEEEIE